MRRPADLAQRRLPGARGLRELALFGGVYVLYDLARWLFAGRLTAARAHADVIIHLERSARRAPTGVSATR